MSDKWQKAPPSEFRERRFLTHVFSSTALNSADPAETLPREITPVKERRRRGIRRPEHEHVASRFGGVVDRRRSSWPRPSQTPSTTLHAVLANALGQSLLEPDLRLYPSAGQLYAVQPLVLFPTESQLHLFDADTHRLSSRGSIDLALLDTIAPATTFGRESFRSCSMIVFLVGALDTLFDRYGALALRLALLEAGHMGHALQLAATEQELRSIPIAGFFRTEIRSLLNLDEDEECLYLIGVG